MDVGGPTMPIVGNTTPEHVRMERYIYIVTEQARK